MEKTFRNIVGQVLRNYDNYANKEDMRLFVKEQLHDLGACTDQAELEAAATDICDTIDDIDASFQDLIGARKIGDSRDLWLKGQLIEAGGNASDAEMTTFVREIKTGLTQAQAELLEAEGQTVPLLSEPLVNDEFTGDNRKPVVKNIEADIRNNTLLKMVSDQEIISFDPADETDEISSVKDFFQRPMDAPEDRNIKKAVAAATVAAKNQGMIRPLEKRSVKEISAIADWGVTGAKVAYKVGTGEMDSNDAIDYMVDRGTATVAAMAKKAVPALVSSVGGTVGAFVGSLFSPAGAYIGAEIGGVVGYYAGKAAGPIIEKGVKKVGEAVQKVVRKTWKDLKDFTSPIKEKAKKLFSGLFG